jgi:hypothetical protein
MQNRIDKAKTNGRDRAEHRESEPANPGISRSPQSVAADHNKTSPRRERSVMAQSQMATSRNGESGGAQHPSSPPSSRGPQKIRETAAELESNPSFWAALQPTFGTSDRNLITELVLQITRALPHLESHDPVGSYAVAALHGISPRDTLEGMLSAQMVATHNQAMDFLRQAALKGQPPAGVERNVNLATKLLRTFLAQVEGLDRYRGKGQHKINLAQVHIHGGAQGIVGPANHQESLDAPEDDG